MIKYILFLVVLFGCTESLKVSEGKYIEIDNCLSKPVSVTISGILQGTQNPGIKTYSIPFYSYDDFNGWSLLIKIDSKSYAITDTISNYQFKTCTETWTKK